MSEFIIITLVIALIFAATKVFCMKKDINYMVKSLELIKKNKTNKRINSISMNRNIIKLVDEVNFLLDKKKKDKLIYEKNNKRLKEEITDISHDLRTPLTSIKGYIQYMDKNNIEDENIIKYLNIINEKSAILQELLESFFDFSRIENGEYPINMEKVNVYKVLTNVLISFYNDFILINEEPKIEIESESIFALCDEKALSRVFINLFQNILKHKGKNIEIKLYSDKNYSYVSFSNDVQGITREDVQRIFDRFYVADKTRSKNKSGLGLTIVKGLIDAMDGKITAELINDRLNIEVLLMKF